MADLKGKNIVLGVTGGIAAYKACQVVRGFKKLGANVDVIMTEHATEFVTPLTFETLSNRPVVTDMFSRDKNWEVEHVSLAKKADLFVVCPATANIVGKYANGIADDMLSTTLMATTATVVLCPAMNANMYLSPAYQNNAKILKERGVRFVNAECGFLACGDTGYGRLAEPQDIVDYCEKILSANRDLVGKKVLVTCGATAEKIDDARCITNFSSGKMGMAIATAALERGADVTLVLGNHTAPVDERAKIVAVSTTDEMLNAVLACADEQDIFVMAGAPCDYRPAHYSESKIKSEKLTLDFVKNPDIAAQVGKTKGSKFLCVFSAETDNGVENARKKLIKKNADIAVLNYINNNVFGSDTNKITIVTETDARDYPEMSKREVADLILDKALGK